MGFILVNLFLNFIEVLFIIYIGVKKDNLCKNVNFKGVIFLKEIENWWINEIIFLLINKKFINENWYL